MTIKDFIPPIIFKAKQKFFDKPTPTLKTYASYEEALKECTGYHSEDLCNMVANKTAILKNSDIQYNSTNVFLLAALLYAKPSVVLDFGGACGAHYFETRKYINVKWIVVEHPQIVKAAYLLENDNLSFQTSFTNADFIYSSGTFQSLDKPYEYLEKLLNIGAKYILFNRMMFSDREIITVQKFMLSNCGPGKMPGNYTDKELSAPHTTLDFDKFTREIEKKYKLEWLFSESSGAYEIAGIPVFGKGMLYSLK